MVNASSGPALGLLPVIVYTSDWPGPSEAERVALGRAGDVAGSTQRHGELRPSE